MKFPYPEWDTLAWLLVLFAAFALEAIGLIWPNEATLTQLILTPRADRRDSLRRTLWVGTVIPVWARAMILGWLFWHFLVAGGGK